MWLREMTSYYMHCAALGGGLPIYIYIVVLHGQACVDS